MLTKLQEANNAHEEKGTFLGLLKTFLEVFMT